MRKDIDYWKEVYDEFKRLYSDLDKKVIHWYPSAQMEITIKTEDGNIYAYNLLDKTPKCICDINNDINNTEDINEAEWRIKFGEQLSYKLRLSGFTQETLSRITGITPVTIHKYIRGKATPSAYNLRKIANALHCSVNEFIF